MRNEFTHVAWNLGPLPKDRDGSYLVQFDLTQHGSLFAVASVRMNLSGQAITVINGIFDFDQNRRVVAWASLEGCEVKE